MKRGFVGIVLAVGLWLCPAVGAVEVIQDGGFDLPPSTSPWQVSGPVAITGGVAELQDGGSLYQILDDPAKLPGEANVLLFEHQTDPVPGAFVEVVLDVEIYGSPSQVVLTIDPSDPSPIMYSLAPGQTIPLFAHIQFTFHCPGFGVALIDNVSLDVTPMIFPPTPTPLRSGTPTAQQHPSARWLRVRVAEGTQIGVERGERRKHIVQNVVQLFPLP